MTTREQVEAAPNQRDAMLAIADALDYIIQRVELQPPADDGWGEWTGPAFTSTQPDEDTVLVDIRPVSAEKQARRRAFAEEVLQLPEQYPDVEPDAILDAYVKGGPVWFHGNRVLFMQYPFEVRAAMVADLNEEDPIAAQHMGADVLKQEEDAGTAWVRAAEGRGVSIPE